MADWWRDEHCNCNWSEGKSSANHTECVERRYRAQWADKTNHWNTRNCWNDPFGPAEHHKHFECPGWTVVEPFRGLRKLHKKGNR